MKLTTHKLMFYMFMTITNTIEAYNPHDTSMVRVHLTAFAFGYSLTNHTNVQRCWLTMGLVIISDVFQNRMTLKQAQQPIHMKLIMHKLMFYMFTTIMHTINVHSIPANSMDVVHSASSVFG